MLFSPGTNWSFSDTNFVLLGEILRRVGGMPVSEQIRKRILIPVKLRSTRMTTTAAVPSPTLHGYTNERGPWEDATFWNPSWASAKRRAERSRRSNDRRNPRPIGVF